MNNTHKQDPRVTAFKAYYLDSNNSKTFCNITQAGVAAGYSIKYVKKLTGRDNIPKWWTEFQKEADFMRAGMLRKAEARLDERLTENVETKEDKKLQTDVAKFVSERVGKQHYSTRQEVTGADGRRLFTNETAKDADIELETLFVGVAPQDQAPNTPQSE